MCWTDKFFDANKLILFGIDKLILFCRERQDGWIYVLKNIWSDLKKTSLTFLRDVFYVTIYEKN